MYSKVVQSGDLIEVYEYQYEPKPKIRATKKSGRPAKRNTRRKDNVGRLRTGFKRLVRANLGGTERPIFLTLTMVEVVRVDVAYRLLTEFVVRLRRVYGPHFRYIAVPEFQKRGTVHFHTLFWGLPQETIEHERSTRTIQSIWARGYLDCLPTDGSFKLAGYLSKYMSKAVLDGRLSTEKAYSCSRNVLRPMSSTLRTIYHNFQDTIPPSSLLSSRTYDTFFMGQCTYKCYKINEKTP